MCLAALAVFGALSKLTFLFMAGLSVGVIVCDLGLRGQRRLGLGVAAGFGAAFILGWIATGQYLAHLGAFLANAANVSQGYEQAMAMEGLPILRWRGAMTVLLAVGMVALRTLTAFEREDGNGPIPTPPPERRAPALRGAVDGFAQSWSSALRWRRGLLWAWGTALLFIIWKHGFVMVERRHVVFFFGFVLMLTPALEVLPGRPGAARSWGRGLGAGACLLTLVTLQTLFFPDNLSPLYRPFFSFRDNLRSLLNPAEYVRQMKQLSRRPSWSVSRCRGCGR